MTVLLSIKPEFADKIFSGEKKYEYRKSIFKHPDVKRIIVYSSSPQQRIIGEFYIEEILQGDIEMIWDKTHLYSGISKEYFMSYFANRNKGYAIKIGKTKKYRKMKLLSDLNLTTAPQSFIYIKDE